LRPIIHSKKHILQKTLTNVGAGTADTTIVAHATEAVSVTPEAVEVGAIVKAVWAEIWLQDSSASTAGSFTAIFFKNPGGNANATAANLAALHDYDNKKNILYTTQGLSPTTDSGVLPIMRQWVKIPKGKQRMGLGDKLNFVLRNNNGTPDTNICGHFQFKEYS